MYQMEQKNADIMNAKNVGIDFSHYKRWKRFHVQTVRQRLTCLLYTSYKDEWKKYFEKTLEPIMKKRLVESHERKRKLPSNFKNLLKENIVLLENSILKTT